MKVLPRETKTRNANLKDEESRQNFNLKLIFMCCLVCDFNNRLLLAEKLNEGRDNFAYRYILASCQLERMLNGCRKCTYLIWMPCLKCVTRSDNNRVCMLYIMQSEIIWQLTLKRLCNERIYGLVF